ncbi:MAG: conjugal transfer protein TraD, partial [Achromobacter sp.]|nr:conjugal transfer protein TraD [Achromobacter sp.]
MLVRRYEMPWRRAFEAHAGLVWLAASLYFALIALIGPLPVLPSLVLAAACLLMACRRTAQALRILRLRGSLGGRRIQGLSTQELGRLCTDPA